MRAAGCSWTRSSGWGRRCSTTCRAEPIKLTAALDCFQQLEQLRALRLEQLRREIDIGIEQLDRGEGRPLDIEAIKAEGRRRLARRKKVVEQAE